MDIYFTTIFLDLIWVDFDENLSESKFIKFCIEFQGIIQHKYQEQSIIY